MSQGDASDRRQVHGVDLTKPLGNQQFQEIHDALMDNLVIFLRDQKLSVDQHADFGRKFGKLHIHPASRSPIKGNPQILLIKADETSKHVAGEVWPTGLIPGACVFSPKFSAELEQDRPRWNCINSDATSRLKRLCATSLAPLSRWAKPR